MTFFVYIAGHVVSWGGGKTQYQAENILKELAELYRGIQSAMVEVQFDTQTAWVRISPRYYQCF